MWTIIIGLAIILFLFRGMFIAILVGLIVLAALETGSILLWIGAVIACVFLMRYELGDS